MEGLWYIEDMQSKNGTQIKGFLEDKLYNIRDGQSRLVKNDYIFIGLNKFNTMQKWTYVFKEKIWKYMSIL